jgi:hypothetical protein
LSTVARWLHGAGRAPDAFAIRDEIAALSQATQDDQQGVNAAYACVMLTGELGDVAGAREMAVEFHPTDRLAMLTMLGVRAAASGATPLALAMQDDLSALRDGTPPGPERARADVRLAELRAALGDAPGAAELLGDALPAFQAADLLKHGEEVGHLARVARQAGLTALFDAAVGALSEQAARELDGIRRGGGGGYTLAVRASAAASALAELGALDLALGLARRLSYYERGDALLAVVRELVAAKEFDRDLAVADEIAASYREGPMRVFRRRGTERSYADDAAALVLISGGLAAEGAWRQALDVTERLVDNEAHVEATSRIAIRQHRAGLANEAAGSGGRDHACRPAG